jgi:hypothetical protein
MKFDPAVNGMNIDAEPYRNAGWSVIVFKMLGSSSPIRKQAELGFDALFGRPIVSRE